MKRALSLSFAPLVVALGCAQAGDSGAPPPAAVKVALDDVTRPAPDVSLVVLRAGADREAVTAAIEAVHGTVYHAQGGRLLVARVPEGADAILSRRGVVARYQRSVDPKEVPSATPLEARFIRVFDNRYYPATTLASMKVRAMKRVLAAGEPFETAPRPAPAGAVRSLAAGAAAPEPLDRIVVPYASGTVVVSVMLPESNGVAEPSTEDWTEDSIVETYAKIQAALEAIARTEPNAGLRFILHYESAPAPGGLPGTIDSDYEFGKHANFNDGVGETMVSAPLLARVLGHPVTTDQLWDASYEYLNKLRAQYGAEGAFTIKVAANTNYTAGLRAHAYINGPWTTLSTDYGYETFMHEFGHIFGAFDEYCPDACTPTTAQQGYVGIANANATYRSAAEGGDGIDDGHGEDESSLMNYNSPVDVNGYTRAAWGWLDLDGDGVIDVRDTFPKSDLRAVVDRTGRVRLAGTVADLGMTRIWGGERRSINRMVAVEWRPAGAGDPPWMRAPVTAPSARGAAEVDLDLGVFPKGKRAIEVRAINSVGNVEPTPVVVPLDVTGGPTSAPPRARLSVEPAVGSTRTPFTLRASTLELSGEVTRVRFDANGDGYWDGPFADARTATARFASAGVHTVRVQARDARGGVTTATAEVLVTDGNAAPEVSVSAPPSILVGSSKPGAELRATDVRDPDGDAVTLNWVAEFATASGSFRRETGFVPGNERFAPQLFAPASWSGDFVDLLGGQRLGKAEIRAVLPLGRGVLAVANDWVGLVFVDVRDPRAPRFITKLDLETAPDQLALDGTNLYVAGPGALAVVDVTNPFAPVERKQSRTARATRESLQEGPQEIPDGTWDLVLSHWLGFGERVEDVSVEVSFDHPAPSELQIVLAAQDGTEALLWDHAPGAPGPQTLTFTRRTTPALAALVGKLAVGEWSLRVSDGAAGNAGTVTSSRLTLRTATRAVPTLADARLIGAFGGRFVVVAGMGFQVFDADSPRFVREISRLTGTGAIGGGLRGRTAVVMSPVNPRPPKGAAPPPPSTTTPETRGLYAVDLSFPQFPRVRRVDTTFGDDAGDLAVVGGRFYVSPYGSKEGGVSDPSTQIHDVAAFASGRASLLGVMPGTITHEVFGDDRHLWANGGGRLQHWDVTTPSAARMLVEYLRPWAGHLTRLEGDRAIVWDGSPSARIGDLNAARYVVSRTFRVTLQARDAKGAVTEVSRPIQVIPYDHAPTIDAVTQTSGSTTADTFAFEVRASDPDQGTTWDPTLLVRADLDGDGVFEGDWLAAGTKEPLIFSARYPQAGSRTVRFQVRDAFFGTREASLAFDVR